MTNGARTAARPEIKTIASVGDQAMPPTRGEPGSSVVAGNLDPEPKRDPKTKVSGRVVDQDGRPIANAIVRPADGSLPAGRVVEATTDAAGGFTLHGLRAGTRYTLIAEYDTDDGVKTGRVETRSSETDVEIALDGVDGATRVGSGKAFGKARSVSNPQELDDPDEIPPPLKSPSRVNLDDIPTSDEVESGAVDLDRPARPKSSGFGKAPSTGWKGRSEDGRVGTKTDGAAQRVSSRSLDDPPPAREARAVTTPAPVAPAEEEGDNPLPPAIDPGSKSTEKKDDLSARPAAPVGLAAAERMASASSGGFRLAKPEPASPRSVTWEETETVAQQPTVRMASAAPVQTPPARVESAPIALPAEPARKVKWGELEPPRTTNPSPARVAESGAAAPTVSAIPRGSPPPTLPAGTESVRYDSRNQKLTDFRLPDTQGRLVSFQDFKSDYVLLDFWGSWCRPCVESVPKLVDLQKKFGNAKIQVVGIACEKGTFEQRAGKAQNASTRLGVNYPVLVSSAEEFSPVQNAFKIKSFPTLILIDRQGRVVWREQGAAPTTLARLDGLLDRSLGSETLRR